jgi:hypothetical protein
VDAELEAWSQVDKGAGVVDGVEGIKIPNEELSAPPPERGLAPIGEDGYPVELHHPEQLESDVLDEMTRTDHRLGDNFAKNHTNTGSELSDIDRSAFNSQRRQYWRNEWDGGRFNGF